MHELVTERLLLRPFAPEDQQAFMAIAGDWQVARMTADLPHPLDAEDAAQWLEPEANSVRFAVTLDDRLIGGVGYYVEARDEGGVAAARRGELGFFLARDSWGRGFAVEAALVVIVNGFNEQDMSLFTSAHFIDNAASAKVLAKLCFELAGRKDHWCRARAADIVSLSYQLDRDRAATLPLYRDGGLVHKFVKAEQELQSESESESGFGSESVSESRSRLEFEPARLQSVAKPRAMLHRSTGGKTISINRKAGHQRRRVRDV